MKNCKGCVFDKGLGVAAITLDLMNIGACSSICGKCVRNPNNEFSCVSEDLYLSGKEWSA